MLAALIVLTALLVALVGLRAERRRATRELWLCNAVAGLLLAMTVAGHAAGRVG